MAGFGTVGKLDYASFYLPALAFGYLAFVSSPVSCSLTVLGTSLNLSYFLPQSHLLILIGYSLLGAMSIHGIANRIYGPEGPEKNPKNRWVFTRHTIAIASGVHPDKLQKDPDNAAEFVFGMSDNLDISDLLRMTIRIPLLLPAFTLKYLNIASVILLAITLCSGTGGYLVGVLILAQVVLLKQSDVWSLFPAMVSPARASNVEIPEYRRQSNSRKRRGRIDTNSRENRERR